MRQRCSHRQRTEPIPQIAGGFWVFFLCLSLPELCSLQLVQWEHRALVPHAVSTVFGHLPPSASANLYFGTVNWFLCFLWADKNLSFSKVLVFKLCKSFFFLFPLNPMSQLKSKLKGSWAVDALRGRHANRFDGCESLTFPNWINQWCDGMSPVTKFISTTLTALHN